MNIATRPRIVLLGMMSKMPVAGVVWQTMHYLVGFQRLGCDVFYVEAHGCTPRCFMMTPDDDGCAKAATFIEGVMRRFDLAGRWCYDPLYGDDRTFGMSDTKLRELYASADLIINLHGGTEPQPEHAANGRLVYLETDPVELQIELLEQRPQTLQFLEPHSAFFSFGENLGAPDCKVPLSDRFQFKPTRQPVVMDFWEQNGTGLTGLFTSVGNWRQVHRQITYAGETYHWNKEYEFQKFIDLPSRTSQALELALSSYEPADKALLESKGWRVRHGLDISNDLDAYRAYITGSRGEFTVAKDQNVRLRSGWFSDRSATYLAAGRPVITQETGFCNLLPTGCGLFGFSTMDEILAAIETINSSYEENSRAAMEIARDYFNYDVVLKSLLKECGVRVPYERRVRNSHRRSMRVLLVSHRFPPDAMAGVERYTQALASELMAAGDTVRVVARRPSPELLHIKREYPDDSPAIYRLTGGDVRRERFLMDHEEMERLFDEILAETTPDVVHINHLIDLSPRFVEIAHRRGAAVVLTLHDFYFACQRITLQKSAGDLCTGPEGGRECAKSCFPSEKAGDAERRWLLRTKYFWHAMAMAERVICPAQHVGAFFERFGADPKKVFVIPNGTFVELLDPAEDPLAPGERGALSLAFLGAVLPHKGVHVILDALRLAELGPVNLMVAGPTEDANYVRELREKAVAIPGLRLCFYGTYEPADLTWLLHDVDCVIVPSLWQEIFCLVAREALVRGVPIAVSRIGALPEAVEEGRNGFTFDPWRPAELAEILERLATDDALVRQLREGARASEIMNMRDHADAVRGVYQDAIDDFARGGAGEKALEDFNSLHEAALAAGFGSPR